MPWISDRIYFNCLCAVRHGANVNAQDFEGHTALHDCVSYRRLSVGRLLLAANADVHIRDRDGDTPLDRAADAGNVAMVTMLLEFGGDPMSKNKVGVTFRVLCVNDTMLILWRIIDCRDPRVGCVAWNAVSVDAGPKSTNKY